MQTKFKRQAYNKNKSILVKDEATIKHFITTYTPPNAESYQDQLTKVNTLREGIFNIYLDDFNDYLNVKDDVPKDKGILNRIETNTLRYLQIFKDVCYKLLPQRSLNDITALDSVDILTIQREQNKMTFPPELKAKFETYLIPRSTTPITSLRQLRANKLGHLVRVKGVVTRATDVRPLARVVTYTCNICNQELYQTVVGNRFLPQYECLSKACQRGNKTGTLTMQPRASKFVKVQELRIQELIEEVPMGATPRALVVIIEGTLVQTCAPGDVVTISGVYAPQDFFTKRDMHVGFVSDTQLRAQSVSLANKSFEVLYDDLASSLAPEVFGLLDVKKALLTTVVGAPTQRMDDGVTIRGDINTLLVGEPGIAKSQLLRAVSGAAPRSVYTTGKGSSGAGLTAAVMKDSLTKEWVLEGGALVLADLGICCIDEFDKMDDGDRTAIYEVMEQQSISIAKAGITTSLNARVSIVAAANPVRARYDRRKTVAENVNMPAALVSRFDLLFVLLDDASSEFDKNLAKFVCMSHRGEVGESNAAYDLDFLRAFIGNAKNFNPIVPKTLTNYLVECYVNMRQNTSDVDDIVITPRSLLAIIRISQAIARLRFSNEVTIGDVDEATRLIRVSRDAIEKFQLGKNLLVNNDAIDGDELDEIMKDYE
ncbi:DNA replication licensing factor MCM7 [Entamoeba marina]